MFILLNITLEDAPELAESTPPFRLIVYGKARALPPLTPNSNLPPIARSSGQSGL